MWSLGLIKMRLQRLLTYAGIANFFMLAFLTVRDPFIDIKVFAVLAALGCITILYIDGSRVMGDELAETWDRNPRNLELLDNQKEILRRLKHERNV